MTTQDDLYAEACIIARKEKTFLTATLQRKLRIGYPRAARLTEAMELEGLIKRNVDGWWEYTQERNP